MLLKTEKNCFETATKPQKLLSDFHQCPVSVHYQNLTLKSQGNVCLQLGKEERNFTHVSEAHLQADLMHKVSWVFKIYYFITAITNNHDYKWIELDTLMTIKKIRIKLCKMLRKINKGSSPQTAQSRW